MAKFLLIDGNSIINRAFYGVRMLTSPQGTPTNAVYGFLNIFLKQLADLAPDYVAVAFDLRAKTFRHKKYEAYKANRKGMPDDLAVQMPILKEILSCMNVKIFELEGYEADDLIGTVASRCKQAGVECYISTGDKDDLQLAGEKTRILLVTTKNHATQTKVYTEAEVLEDYGLTPSEFIDLKAIMGDKSDNIPGVAGIGEVGAKALIQQFKSVENLYENLDSPAIKPAMRQKLEKDREMAFLSKELATIDQNVPISFDFDACRHQPYDRARLSKVLRALNFQSILSRLELENAGEEGTQQAEAVAFERLTGQALSTFADQIRKGGVVYFLLADLGGELCGAFCGQDGAAPEDSAAKASVAAIGITRSTDDTLVLCRMLLPDPSIQKVGNHLKEDMLRLQTCGVSVEGDLFDTAIGCYLLFPALPSYRVCDNAQSVLGSYLPEIADEPSLAQNLAALFKMRPVIERQIEENGMHTLFYEIELPLIRVLYDIQHVGFTVDKAQLSAFSELLDGQIRQLTEQIYMYAGCEFNINSTKQLGEVLFEKLNLPVIKKTKTGYGTDVEVLHKLQGKHEIIDCLLQYRTLTKLKSTYADGLAAVIDSKTGKIHSNFNQTVTQTGRLSSTEPNLQNIPVRTELGREIRRFFVASEGFVLVDADYSQIELRVLAHISGDENMIQAFIDGHDIHQSTASKAFGVPLSEVTPEMRRAAKAVNFGLVYGISDFGLSQDLHITRREAKGYIDAYFEKYPGVRKYMTEVVEQAKKDGYVTTLFGRRRYLPELQSTNFMTRSLGERMALNTPIQGTAADIIKIAMVRVHRRLIEQQLSSRLILQVHDELIVEAAQDEVDEVKRILKDEMEHAATLRVPLVCDMNTGHSWYDAK